MILRQRRGHTTLIYVLIILIFTAGYLGYSWLEKKRKQKYQQENLLLEASLMEVRFRRIDVFTRTRIWFHLFWELEALHHRRYKVYFEPHAYPPTLWRSLNLDRISRNLRLEYWENLIHLKSFLGAGNFEQAVRQTTVTFFDSTLTLPHAGLHLTSFTSDSQAYTIRFDEKSDINFDGDTQDYFLLQSEWKRSLPRFITTFHQEDLEAFVGHYAERLEKSEPPLSSSAEPDRPFR